MARGAQAERAAQAVAREHPVAWRAGVEMHEARARVPADAARAMVKSMARPCTCGLRSSAAKRVAAILASVSGER